MALTTDNKASRLFKALMGVSETKTIRDFFEEPIRSAPAVLPSQIWQYGNWIPTGSADDPTGATGIQSIQAMQTDQQTFSVSIDPDTSVIIIKRWINCQFTMIDAGTDNAFKLIDNTTGKPIQNIIPFNFGDGTSYNYNLYKSDGTPIAFGIGDWVFDPNSGVLTFYSPQNVSNVSHSLPPKMSFYQYVGGLGAPSTAIGYDGAILSINNYNGGAGTTAWSDSTLDGNIVAATNLVQNNFIANNGWTGSDTSTGVAVSYQKLIPLINSVTKDPIASGSGLDAAEVMTLMARRGISSNLSQISGFLVDFVSQGTPIGSLAQVSYNASNGSFALSFDGGNTWGPTISGANTLVAGQAIKVKNGSDFAIIRRVPGTLPTANAIDSLTITDTSTRVALLVWNSSADEFIPYVNQDSVSTFSFGFPITMKLGRIPPSLKLGQTSLGGYSDVITPQYYGVRPTSVIVVVSDIGTPTSSTANTTGADYTVTNTAGGYLGDVISKIYNNNPNFVGEVILRQGRYKLNSDLTFNGFSGLKIKAEAPQAVIIDSNGATRNINIQAGGAYENDVFFYDLTFSGTFTINLVAAGTQPALLFMRGVVGPSVSINVAALCGYNITDCGSLSGLTVNGASTLTRSAQSSTFNTVNLLGSGSTLHGSVINTLTGDPTLGITNAIIACQISTLVSLNEANQYIGNSVVTYGGAVTAKFKMSAQKFEIIDSDGFTRRWTGFAGPIIWDNTAKQFKLSIDTAVMAIDGNGKLTVNLAASVITFDPTGVVRADGTNVTATNVQNALVDMYSHKADLGGDGKININQLPASITGGGMAYKGMWSFSANSGAYPTATDIAALQGGIGSGSALQPGWFVLISAGPDAASPVKDQTAVLQAGESTPITFTAGDWAVFNGTIWERVDNSFADPSYTILPSTPPGGQWTDGLLTLGGTTIVDATDQINEILLKLAPPKPYNLTQMTLAFKSTATYTAAESGSGSVRTAVINATQPAITTPQSPDSVSTLFYYSTGDTLSATIDGTSVGSAILAASSNVGIHSALNIVANNDPWAGTAGKQNFWLGLRAEVNPTSALALGAHNVIIVDSGASGATPAFTFYVDNPAVTMSITGSSITTSPPMSKYLSGVPGVQPSSSFILSAFNAAGVVGQYYNSTAVATIACNVSGVSSVNCAAASVPATPSAGTYGNAAVSSRTISMPSSAYSESINFVITPFNTKGVSGTATTLTSGYRIDTTVETERVFSGDPTTIAPSISVTAGNCGATFDSTQSLVVAGYVGELQKINGKYKWPVNVSYAAFVGSNGAGPNYTGASGSTVTGFTGSWRWVTYKFTGQFSNNSAFTITFNGGTGLSVDVNQIVQNMMIFTKVVGASGTGWINANAAYSGVGSPLNDGDAAMVAGNSDVNNRRVTFGPTVHTGDLYVRIAINSTSGIQFSGITIGSLA